MATKKIIFLSSSGTDILAQLDKIREYRQQPDWTAVMIAFGYDAQRTCRQHGIPFKTSIDYLGTERHYRVFTGATKLAGEWYKQPAIEKTLNHDGVSLGAIMEYEIRSFLAGFLLDIELYQGILETEKPDRIALVKKSVPEPETQNPMDMGDQDEFIVSSLSAKAGISLEWISPAPESLSKLPKGTTRKKSASFPSLNSLIAKIRNYACKFFFLDWRVEIRRDFLKAWHYCFCSWKVRRAIKGFSQKKRRIAFLNLRCASDAADYLKKDSENGVIFLMGPGEKQRSMRFLPPIYLESFSTPEINRIVEEKRRVFRGILEQTEAVNYLKKIFSYNDLNFWEVAGKKLELILDMYIPLMVRGMELIKEMMERTGLDVFISSSDVNSVIRAMTKAMQHKGKKTLVIHHGIDYFGPEVSEFFGKSLVPPFADKIATWGEASRDWFISHGANPDSVAVTSCSDFNSFLKMLTHSKSSIRRYLGIPQDKTVILYALDHANKDVRHPYIVETRDEIIKHLQDVTQEIARLPRLHLIVRPNPGDYHPEEIEQIVKDAGQMNITYSVPGLPILFYLQAADILITYTSSSALDAMIFDNDVIIYNPTNRPEVVPYVQEGAAIRVEGKEDLIPKILEIMGNDSLRAKLAEARHKFVSRNAGPIDGKAAQNTADLILRMINSDKR